MTDLISSNEDQRLSALTALELLDTPAEARFDRYTRLATRAFGVPISLISLVDAERQWFKSRCGLETQETARSLAFCSHAVQQRDLFVVDDAALDPRFADNPLVLGTPHIRFYAGQPIYSEGQAVGTLCIIDRAPRSFDQADRDCLRELAELVEIEINQARVVAARLIAEQALKSLNTELERRIETRTAELEDKVAQLSSEIVQRNAAELSLRESEGWNRTIVASSYSGFIGIGQDGRITEWNPSAERIFGWTRAEMVGQHLAERLVPPAMREAHARTVQRFFATTPGTIIEQDGALPALTASGRQITVEMSVSVYEWQGQRCLGAFINDISSRIRAQHQLEEKQELLDAVLETIDVAVVACDAVGNLTLFNRSARSMHGRDLKSIAPAEWARYYALTHVDGRTPLAMDEIPLVRALKGETVHDQALMVTARGGEAHTLLASGRPLRSAAGRTLGAVVVMKDITDVNASRERLATNERMLRAITENLPAMMGKVDSAGKFVFLNNHALKAYGKSAHELIGFDVANAYSADDFERVSPHIASAMAGNKVFFEHVDNSRAQPLHYQCCFMPQRLSNGQPDGYFAMAFDITARKLSELRRADSEERLRTITDNVPVLIAQFGPDRRYVFANAVHQSWLGSAPQDVLGHTMLDAFGAAYYAQQVEAFEQAWHGRASQCEHEITRKTRTRIVHSTYLPQLRDGAVVGVYVLTTDATVSRMHERSLHALAHTDSLTTLPNRRHFEHALQTAAGHTRQAERKVALLYLDIDHFKQINDQHGHAVGDAVLVEFAQRLRAAVRSTDLAARLAGDEFTVLLGDVQAHQDVELVAQKILAAVREPFKLGDCELRVSTTIGAALSTGLEVTARTLLEQADRALYSAKRAGRNTLAIEHIGTACSPLLP